MNPCLFDGVKNQCYALILTIIECESMKVDASSIAFPLSILLRSSTSGRAAGIKERLFDSNHKNILENEVADASLPFRRVAHDSLPFNTSLIGTSLSDHSYRKRILELIDQDPFLANQV